MSSKPILYYVPVSPPVRSVLLIAKALDLELDLKLVDFTSGVLLKPEYLKLNPQHTVPTLVDNGVPIWDSHAICTYLIGKYGKTDELYPKDLVTRAHIDQRLQFDTAHLFSILKEAVAKIFYEKAWEIEEKNYTNAKLAFAFLETFLTTNKFLVGNNRTVADFSIITTVTQIIGILKIDVSEFPKVQKWIAGFDELPYFKETNTNHLNDAVKLVHGLMVANKTAAASK